MFDDDFDGGLRAHGLDECPFPEGWDDDPTDGELLAAVAGHAPGLDTLYELSRIDVRALSADDAVTYLQQVERLAAFTSGLRVQAQRDVADRLIAHELSEKSERAELHRRANEARVADGLPPRSLGETFVAPEQVACAEIAPALRLSTRGAECLVQDSIDLTGPWRPLLDAMLAGDVSDAHVRAISRELRRAPAYGVSSREQAYAQMCAAVLTKALPYAQTHTARESGRRTAMLVCAADPDGARERRRRSAERDHNVTLTPTEPGTCEITAVMPLIHGHAVMDAVNRLARHEKFEVADGCVTMGQRRVAAFATLMLGEPGTETTIDGPVSEVKIRADISVVVPLATMTGFAEQGGVVGRGSGTEPVGADALIEFLRDCDPSSTFRRLVTDVDGCILDAGRTRYAVSEVQRRIITLRDQYCRHPGCTEPAFRCEVDHAIPYDAGGRTDLDNCGALCKYHHQHKTHSGWRILKSARNGSCTWRSPLGRIYEHTPPDLIPPPPDRVPVPMRSDDEALPF